MQKAVAVFWLLLVPFTGNAQQFADKSYYLVDSLDLDDISDKDRRLIDSCLRVYHTTDSDTTKIKILDAIVAGSYDEKVWLPYNVKVYNLIEQALRDKTLIHDHTWIFFMREAAMVLNNFGYYYKSKGRTDEALDYYSKSLNIFKQLWSEKRLLPDQRSIATVLNNMGIIYEEQGDIQKALNNYMESLAIKIELDYEKGIALAYNNIGFVYDDQGDKAKALEYYTKSVEILEKIGEKAARSNALNNIGTIYREQKKLTLAEDYFTRCLEMKEELNDRQGIAMSLNNIASVYRLRKQFKLALEYSNKSLLMAEEIGYKKGMSNILFNIAETWFELDSIDLAAAPVKRSYAIAKEIKNPASTKNAALLLSAIELGATNYDLAEQYLLEVLQIDERSIALNFALLSEQKKELFFKKMSRDYMWFYSFALKRKISNPAITEKVYNATLQTKGVLLKSSAAMRQAVLTSGDDELIALYYQWLNTRGKIARYFNEGKDTRELEDKAEEIERELIIRSQDFSQLDKIQKLTWKDVQAGLGKNEAAVEFIHFKNYASSYLDSASPVAYCALIVTAESEYPRMIELFEEPQLEKILGSFQGNNLKYINSVYGKRGEKKSTLYNLVWKPMEQQLEGIKKVFVSPSGLLHKISFAALSKEPDVYLCDHYTIQSLASTGKVVLTEDFVFDNRASTTIFGGINYNTDSSTSAVWSYLEGTKYETEKIISILGKKNMPVSFFTSSVATESEFKIAAGQSTILHVATHGFFYPDPRDIQAKIETDEAESGEIKFRGRGFGYASFVENENPLMRSGLVFAGANEVWSAENGNGDDGVLTAQEVAHIDMRNTKLVVLSACETGLGDIKGSEGVYGLQRAFKMAGVKFIIMSLWQVPDKETAEFMTLFYKHLVTLKDIPAAFQKTQKLMREKYDPYYWAAFVLIE